ncbi:GNAT family N-acetyltransferase [Allorhizobium undicola]|uniref:GNAT family N-acetyltransferase n=1 Tax=Allorhizobium undicola TaxID=78527 RepID=UPI000485723B|nr:GNAT family N-acetyltransferase [Allorhizobium undicola]
MTRVRISPACRRDGPELVAANIASRDWHAPYAEPFTTLDGFHLWLDQIFTGPQAALVAREVESDGVVGVFTFSQISMGLNFRSAYLGYYGMAAFQGRGLMSEALELVTRYGFEDIRLLRIEANIQPDNHRSLAMVRRAGFEKEGYSRLYLRINGAWQDHERWTKLAR